MAKSDIENMIEWKKRRGANRLASMLIGELDQLARAWKEKAADAGMFADFVPMRTVTIVEVFVRDVVRELVDSGDTYLQRAEQLSKGARLDFALLSGLQGKKISVGDLIAHTISINEPARIIAYLESLIPNFVAKLKTSHERWTEERNGWPLKPIIRDYDAMMRQLTKLFAVRHILTHELPIEPPFDPAEIEKYLVAAKEFVEATDWVMVGEIHGSVPRTQLAMNIAAGETVEAIEAEMSSLLEAIKKKGDVSSELLHASQSAWEEFSRREADLRASLVEGGSMYGMIWASTRAEEIKHRVEALHWWMKINEGDL
ncbi:lysozyme inhibitor LprI family protein [Mesorhizobium sp. SB112]|uniref:lysozyme inhibitor LprI family protein n=1 Tax=Mesorhizobium sp. SB112 TaxID=3151853 RepID=UPI00326624A3